jgi:hypothetical protein
VRPPRLIRRASAACPKSVDFLADICRLAHIPAFEDDLRDRLRAKGGVQAVRHHDGRRLFDWLMEAAVYQGVSDAAAQAYAIAHGTVRYEDLAQGLAEPEPCPRLASFDALTGCGYRKLARSCAEPALFDRCPLPRHDLRNGRLNQAAYSLYLFLRDVCGGDLVSWLDQRLAFAECGGNPNRLARLRAAVLPPFKGVVGIGEKVATMLLADLLIGADPGRERWVACGRSMVVVDTLVHAFLHRTGILARHAADHRYGRAATSRVAVLTFSSGSHGTSTSGRSFPACRPTIRGSYRPRFGGSVRAGVSTSAMATGSTIGTGAPIKPAPCTPGAIGSVCCRPASAIRPPPPRLRDPPVGHSAGVNHHEGG